MDADGAPHFLGIGAQRAGTTWVHQCLAEHPEVYVPTEKELHFFDSNFENGVDWYRAHFPPQFVDAVRIAGEITPTYLGSSIAAQRIAELRPNAKLFVILRDPLDRAYSAYQLFKETRFATRSFEVACRPGSDLVRQGLYAQHLARFLALFPRERLRVWLYDDVLKQPANVLRELFEYLGVQPTFLPPSVMVRYNRVVFPKAQRMFERLGFGPIVDRLKRTKFGAQLKRRHAERATPVRRDPELIAYFREDIQQLQSMIGRDLSHWLS